MPWKQFAGYAALAAAALLLTVVVTSLLVRQPHREEPKHDDARLFCGVSMRAPMQELVTTFQRDTGMYVRPVFGPSDQLLEHLTVDLEAADLYLPGETSYLEQGETLGLVERSESVAWLVPAILVQPGNPHDIAELADLTRPGLRLAVADARVPARGCRTRALGGVMPLLWERHGVASEEIEPNVILTATTGHELGSAVQLGHVDAAVVWDAVALRYPPAEVVAIPENRNVAVPVRVGLLAHARENTVAAAFVDFLGSAVAREILRAHHYSLDFSLGKSEADR